MEKLSEKHLSPEERAEVAALGGFDKLIKTLRERLSEQQGRHQGGSKWICTHGTSWARDGAAEEADLDGTIRATAENGYLDVQTRLERRNVVKVLLFLDVGGSMAPHVRVVEQLFSAARVEFKHLEHWHFHNCLYEGIWRDNRRRWDAQSPTMEVLRTYGPDWKCIFVGDASMSRYYPPRRRERALERAPTQWPAKLWINPVPQRLWDQTPWIRMIGQILEGAMVPMTLEGIAQGVKALGR